jgi:SHAQKYF class myb-like DNA-binding protein
MNGNELLSIHRHSDNDITITDENYSDNDKYVNLDNVLNNDSKFSTGRWTHDEHVKFIEAMFLYGNEWKKVQEHIKTRSSTQARSHAQKFFIRLKKKLLEENIQYELKDKNINKRNEIIMSWIQDNVNSDIIKKISNTVDNMYIEKRDKLCKIIMNILTNPIKRKSPKVTVIKNCCSLGGRGNKKECNQICCIDESNLIKEYERRKSTYSILPDDSEIFRIEKINKDNDNYSMPSIINQNNYYNIVTINLCKDDELNINDISMNRKIKQFTDDNKSDPFKLNFYEEPMITNEISDINLNFDLDQFFNVDNFLN